jgi:hypothetical protein
MWGDGSGVCQCAWSRRVGAMLVYPRGGWGIPCDAWRSPVGLLNVFQAGLELVSDSGAALLFSQCNVV